jgi:hypothetical protein
MNGNYLNALDAVKEKNATVGLNKRKIFNFKAGKFGMF